MREERVALSCRKGGDAVGFGLALMLEEDLQIAFSHVAQRHKPRLSRPNSERDLTVHSARENRADMPLFCCSCHGVLGATKQRLFPYQSFGVACMAGRRTDT